MKIREAFAQLLRRMDMEAGPGDVILERLSSSPSLGIVVTDRRGTILHFNRGAECLTGYPAQEVIGKKRVGDLYANRADLARITRALVQNGGADGLEAALVHRDGTTGAVLVSASAVPGENGRLAGSVALFVDVSEKKRLEKELFRAEKLRALGEMAGGVAHDFNNVLSTILGNVEMILKQGVDPAVAGRIKVIQEAALTGVETVKRIQEFTRVHPERDFEPVDLNRIVLDSVELTRHRWRDAPQKRGIPLSLSYHLRKLSRIHGNPFEIREVLMNLIFNAVDAMPAGGRLSIKTEPEDRWAVVTLSDAGTGMTEEVHRRIFEPFFTTKGENNTGLGLSVSYGIVKRHEGTIEAESEPGRGTTFRIRLPIIERRRMKRSSSEAGERPDRVRILIIDDDNGVREVLGEFLASAGHDVALAENGHEGIETIRVSPCDVVITDLGMPGMNGWEVIREVRELAPGTACILATGWSDLVDPDTLEKEPVDLVLTKPFQLERLLESIGETLRRKHGGHPPAPGDRLGGRHAPTS